MKLKSITRRRFLGSLAGGAVAGAVGATRIFADDSAGPALPQPSAGSPMTLMEALKNRQSSRSFSPKPIPRQTLAELLWAGFGVNRADSGKRTAPSSWNCQEIDIYAALADGLFVYDAKNHQLQPILQEDIRAMCGQQEFVAAAPLNLIYVADSAKMKKGSDADKRIFSAAHTGFISQNVYLYCASAGLATIVRDWIDRKPLAKKMKLSATQQIVLAQTVGYPE